MSTVPTARSWNGTNTWLTDTNWTPTGVPGSNDFITIQSGTCIFTDPEIVQTLTVSNGATLLFTNWTATLTLTNVIVLSNSVIAHAGCNTNVAGGTSNRIYITTSNLTVNLGGRIDADGAGFAAGISATGQGPGGGTFATSRPAADTAARAVQGTPATATSGGRPTTPHTRRACPAAAAPWSWNAGGQGGGAIPHLGHWPRHRERNHSGPGHHPHRRQQRRRIGRRHLHHLEY